MCRARGQAPASCLLASAPTLCMSDRDRRHAFHPDTAGAKRSRIWLLQYLACMSATLFTPAMRGSNSRSRATCLPSPAPSRCQRPCPSSVVCANPCACGFGCTSSVCTLASPFSARVMVSIASVPRSIALRPA
ncbi:hypothetical protein OBBRIDRAFT_624387 [Obba rivulosa]|uniref:Uncharacterized protein n=1 Tax=Obba rivulosa TaxID=1052685 RepID=A0A8E2ASE7_9APHY|nr:hypothetical protein OBBRIDRAFT_624387 [Obba rivulosa]